MDRKTRRLNLDIPPEIDSLIKELMKRSGITTQKKLFNEMLDFINMCIEEIDEGRRVGSFDANGGNLMRLGSSLLRKKSD